jgi:hypothetical protein
MIAFTYLPRCRPLCLPALPPSQEERAETRPEAPVDLPRGGLTSGIMGEDFKSAEICSNLGGLGSLSLAQKCRHCHQFTGNALQCIILVL